MSLHLVAQGSTPAQQEVSYSIRLENVLLRRGMFFDAYLAIDTPVMTEVSAYLPALSLYEVHLTPYNKTHFSTDNLQQVEGGLAGLIALFTSIDLRSTAKQDALKYRLQHAFAQRIPLRDLAWHFGVAETLPGKVVSVVFGHREALEAVYAAGIRVKT